MAGGWSKRKRETVEAAFYTFLDRCFINSRDVGRVCLGKALYEGQIRFITTVFDALEADIHKIFVLKSRQLGLSTIARALSMFMLGVHSGLKGAIVFDTDQNKQQSRAELEVMINDLPSSLKFPRIKSNNRAGLALENDSQVLFMSAGVKKSKSSGVLGRSVGLSLAHLCMDPDTPVIVGDGKIVPIKHVSVGDRIVTHTGGHAIVIANTGRLNVNICRKITPWLGAPIVCTDQHRIPTARGMLAACEIRADDWVVMPVRTISHEQFVSFLPMLNNRQRDRKNLTSASSGVEISINEELGFAVGYYLAEGSIVYQRRDERYYDYPSGLVFSRHRDERGYADRAIAALCQFTTGQRTTKDKKESLTSTEHVYGAALARWFDYSFGSLDDKRIPDTVFTWGVPFCRGLLSGLLSGDGSKKRGLTNGKYELNEMRLTTTRSSIAMQARDIAASLGYGWAACDYRAGGVFYNRNCKPIWTVRWAGSGAGQLRELIGLKASKRSRSYTNKYKIQNNSVFIKIRKIEDGVKVPAVYDLAVDHVDHTFRTPSMSVSNSELCSYDNDEGLEAFEQSLSDANPDRLYIYESTARGFNKWSEQWSEARADPLHCRCVFLGWWSKPSQRIERSSPDWAVYGEQPPTPTEQRKIKQVKEQYDFDVTPEQLAWVRRKMDPTAQKEGDAPAEFIGSTLRIGEQPWTEEEAFQQTGAVFFAPEKLTDLTNNYVSRKFKTYMFIAGAEFADMRVYPASNANSIELKVWEEPDPDGTYVIAVDPAVGADAKNCRSCIQVFRCFSDGLDQVAEYAWPLITTYQLAWVIAALMGWYGAGPRSEIRYILELNGPGDAVFNELRSLKFKLENMQLPVLDEKGLRDVFRNVRTYMFTRPDSIGGASNFHFKTTHDRKVMLMERYRDFVTTGLIRIRSMELIKEMNSVVRDDKSIGAPGSMKDDRVIAAALGTHCWEEKIRRALISAKRTRENESIKRHMTIQSKVELFNQNSLTIFFRTKQKERQSELALLQRRNWRYGTRRYR